MSEDITELFHRYRRCLREIWNSYFWQHPELRTWDSVPVFERLKPSLFQAIVVESLAENCGCEAAPGSGRFQIVPNVPDESGNRLATHIIVTKTEGGGRSWSEELVTLRASDATLQYVDVFDWSMMGYIDLRYYIAAITNFPERPDLLGREVLIDVYQADVLWLKTTNR